MINGQAPRYQHVQPGPSTYDSVYREALNYLNGAIRQMSSSPHLYTTKATARELQKAAEYLAHLKLEGQLFTDASSKWRERFPEREIVTQRQALLRVKDRFSDPGGQFLARYCTNMHHGNIRCTTDECANAELRSSNQPDGIGWTDTSIREAHEWAIRGLTDLNRELEPLASAAKRRIDQYLDEMDITARYNGYRRNLGFLKKHNSDDMDRLLNTNDTSIRPPMAPRWHLGSDWTRAETVGTQNYTAPGDWNDCHADQSKFMERYNANEDPRKTAGIQLRFPGRSEYQDEYLEPTFAKIGMVATRPPSAHRTSFKQPNYMMHFDGTGQLDSTSVKSGVSETKDKFQWPEPSKHDFLCLPMK
ncbi:hypothetical protein P879_02406 [Paragonimus westermani]|uniref:Uncharacterized protein n=1 Tax=Paragonimus westermani TaxID=34504 RepID=A0A8T0DN88_9TREM|nr:hypothetical protein P879_02406 [Paragonimus westermani]